MCCFSVALRRFLALAFTLISAQAFVFYESSPGNITRWNVNSPQVRPTTVNPETRAIRYYIASDAFSTANRTNEVNAVRAAFDQWQSVPGTSARFEFAGFISPEGLDARYDNTNVVFWAKKSTKIAAGTLDLNGTRALTVPTLAADGSILDADIVLNGVQYQWFTGPNDTANQAQFVESILLHEIGHFLGLDHSTAGGSSVIDGSPGINTNSGLSADDTAGARFLYPDSATTRSAIRGTVRLNGAGVLGAVVIAEDASGNIAGATITQTSGAYSLYALPGGSYNLRVTPLDPANSGQNSLLRGAEVAVDYANAVTTFSPTANLALTLEAGRTNTQDVNLTANPSPLRITSISKPTALTDLPTVVRYAVMLTQGQSNYFVGVNSSLFQNGATLSITGDGLAVGPTLFYANRVGPGQNSLVVPVSVSSNAMPGLRTFVVTQNGSVAYANGYLEIAPAVPDHNFDGLDDRFQRQYWSPWTIGEGAATADPDSDGFSNRYEFRTGSDPKNVGSYFLRLQQPLRGRFGPQVSWISDPGKRYQLYRAASLGKSAWQPVGEPVTALGEVWSLPVNLEERAAFYRLELKR